MAIRVRDVGIEENDKCSFISYVFLRLLILDRKLNMNLWKRFAIAVEQRTGKSAILHPLKP